MMMWEKEEVEKKMKWKWFIMRFSIKIQCQKFNKILRKPFETYLWTHLDYIKLYKMDTQDAVLVSFSFNFKFITKDFLYQIYIHSYNSHTIQWYDEVMYTKKKLWGFHSSSRFIIIIIMWIWIQFIYLPNRKCMCILYGTYSQFQMVWKRWWSHLWKHTFPFV